MQNLIKRLREAQENSQQTAAGSDIFREAANTIENQYNLMANLLNQLGERGRDDGNAPGHSHDKPGIWDSDNGDLAGKPCAWCEMWAECKRLGLTPNEAVEKVRDSEFWPYLGVALPLSSWRSSITRQLRGSYLTPDFHRDFSYNLNALHEGRFWSGARSA